MLSTSISFITTVALVAQVSAFPVLQSRATADTAAWSFLQRAAELSSAAFTGCTGTAFDITITKQVYDLTTNAKGFVGYSASNKKISVVMKGCTTDEYCLLIADVVQKTDILNDVDTTLVVPSLSGVTFPSGARIMNGISSPWSAVHDEIIAEVKSLVEQYPDYSLESTGHSLRGSLTYLSYVALASNFPGKDITSNAMAAFPIGNQAWVTFAESFNGTLNRGNNYDDGVPNMYIQTPYEFVHFGTVSRTSLNEYYSYGTQATCVKCSGERDTSCSAGNGQYSVTPGHFSSFGIALGYAGCSAL
ncbi:lipase [Penicillium odoratum]|uniref:lipase n=1 Tax=Penicillium odoratum TaxID=1167516 RepID=UPI002546A664|nr:lipase [Penicillium odoratum]KAJ5760506.1 lipase [Penicillium odoratum]